MSQILPPKSFRDAYVWRGGSLVGAAAPRLPTRLPFGRDGRIHPSRAPFEYYPTPPEATRALLSVERFDGPIWEPACGEGAISTVLLDAGHDVVSTDLVARGYGEGGIDFLAEREARARHIITNPPYGRGLGDAFVLKALELTRGNGGSVGMLLNLASLCHPGRHDLWVGHPPAVIYALDELVCWPEGRRELARSSTATHRYCWVVWKPDHHCPTAFSWLQARAFRTGQDRRVPS
jgi:predicted RNA methylase